MGAHKKHSYYTNQHSCYLLTYHLVLVTKYRKKVLIGEKSEALIKYIKRYFKNKHIKIEEINTDKDHIHILFQGKPNMNLSVFINVLKAQTSRFMRSMFDFSATYWENKFWTNSYFICAVSEHSDKIVKEYIKNQGRNSPHDLNRKIE